MKKKSLVGWTYKGWEKQFRISPGVWTPYLEKRMKDLIGSKRHFSKVRITIEEIK